MRNIMHVVSKQSDVASLVSSWRAEGETVAYVPTMGALHEGHLSLVKLAREQADRVIVSIFVNPTQFAPHEDLETYPRDIAGDTAKLVHAEVHALYVPSIEEIYPDGPVRDLSTGLAAKGLETDFRPDFFKGVVAVVSRLFDHVRPDVAIFGEKDYQQFCVIREMVADLGLSIDLIGAPIIRDAEGLALSSRNAYLSDDQLAVACRLNKVLFETAEKIKETPERESQWIDEGMAGLLNAGFTSVDYLAFRNAHTLAPIKNASEPGRLLSAVWLDGVRLIDNIPV